MGRRMLRMLAILAAMTAMMGGAQGSATAYTESAKVRAVSWTLSSIDGPHKLTLAVSTGYCVGKPKPRIVRITRKWRPRRVVITVFLRSPKVHFGKHEGCAGVGLGIQQQIRLGHSISHRALYDGSSSPPQRRG